MSDEPKGHPQQPAAPSKDGPASTNPPSSDPPTESGDEPTGLPDSDRHKTETLKQP